MILFSTAENFYLSKFIDIENSVYRDSTKYKKNYLYILETTGCWSTRNKWNKLQEILRMSREPFLHFPTAFYQTQCRIGFRSPVTLCSSSLKCVFTSQFVFIFAMSNVVNSKDRRRKRRNHRFRTGHKNVNPLIAIVLNL